MSTAKQFTLVLTAALLTTMISEPSFALDAPVMVGYGAGSAGNTFVHVDATQTSASSNIYLMILSGAFFF